MASGPLWVEYGEPGACTSEPLLCSSNTATPSPEVVFSSRAAKISLPLGCTATTDTARFAGNVGANVQAITSVGGRHRQRVDVGLDWILTSQSERTIAGHNGEPHDEI